MSGVITIMNNTGNIDKTTKFKHDKDDSMNKAREIISQVYQSLKEKGYDPNTQLIGYLLSGDPTYITNYNNARSLIRKIERDELLEEIISCYLNLFNI